MTVSTQGSRSIYTANGVTTTFNFPYHLKAKSDLKVYLNGTLKTLDTDYTIAGTAPFASGVNVVFGAAPADTTTVKLSRITPVTQSVDLTNSGSFNQEGIEDVLDDAVLKSQESYGAAEDAYDDASTTLAASVAADLATIAADKATVAADKATVAADKATVAADKATVAGYKSDTLGYKNEAATSAAAAATSAAEASAIAAGSFYLFTSVSGTIAGIDKGFYKFSATGGVNLPSPSLGVWVSVLIASNSATITFNRNGSEQINFISDSRSISEAGRYTAYCVDGTNWLIVQGD